MSVVTISRSLGSGGEYIGRSLAEETGFQYIDKDRIADIIKDYGIIKLDDIYNSVSHFWDRMDEYHHTTVKFLTEIIIAVAQHDNVVIAGRGSYGILHEFNNVIHVKIQSPFNIRAANEAGRLGISREEAGTIIKKDDRLRKKFIESNFYFTPNHVDLFDIVLDTSVVDRKDCVKILKMICSRSGDPVRKGYLKDLSDYEVDPVLRKHVAEKMALYG